MEYPSVHDHINDEKFDVSSYLHSVHEHDSLEGIIKSSKEASELLQREDFQQSLSDMGMQVYQSLKSRIAQQVLGEKINEGMKLPKEHYDMEIGSHPEMASVVQRHFLASKASVLSRLGYGGWDELDIGGLDDDLVKAYSREAASSLDQLLDPRDRKLTKLTQNLLDAPNSMKFSDLYKGSQYFISQMPNLATGVKSSAINSYLLKVQHKGLDHRISTGKQAAKNLGIMLAEDTPDAYFGRQDAIIELDQLYNQQNTNPYVQEKPEGLAKFHTLYGDKKEVPDANYEKKAA